MKRRVPSVVVVAGVVGAGLIRSASGQDETSARAAAVLEGFFAAQQTSYVPSDIVLAADSLLRSTWDTGSPTKTVRAADIGSARGLQRPTPASLRDQDARGRAELKKYAVNAALTRSIADHERTIEGLFSETGFRALGGGAEHAEILSMEKDRSAFKVTADVTTWSMFAEAQPDGSMVVSRPENVRHVTGILVPGPDGMLVSDYTWTFAPGSAP